jgi:hypothetical protein
VNHLLLPGLQNWIRAAASEFGGQIKKKNIIYSIIVQQCTLRNQLTGYKIPYYPKAFYHESFILHKHIVED